MAVLRDYIPLFVERDATEQFARLDAADRLALARPPRREAPIESGNQPSQLPLFGF